MTTPAGTDSCVTACPFCHPAPERIVFENSLVIALWDAFPANRGHALIVPRRHVPTWFDASAEERVALMAAVDEARELIVARFAPDGFNIGINVGAAAGQTVFHLHVHLIPRYDGDVPDPRGGVRWVIPAMGNYLSPPSASSGRTVTPEASAAEFSSPDRSRLISGGADDPLLHCLSEEFTRADQVDIAVGSSNLSESALLTGIEWSYRTVSSTDAPAFAGITQVFASLFHHPATRELTAAWVDGYRQRPKIVPRPETAPPPVDVELEPLPVVKPHAVQFEALAALEKTRAAGNTAGLVVLATGLGKTWLSTFDSNRPEYRRILFVAHREEILRQARDTYRIIRPEARLGFYQGPERDPDAEVLFASIQTLGRTAHLERFGRDAFDYIVVDEFHHAAAPTYRRLIDWFRPRFLLGLTATPERTDGGDLLALCQENLAYRCDLVEGVRRDLLCRFDYYGVPDEVDYRAIPWRNAPGQFLPRTGPARRHRPLGRDIRAAGQIAPPSSCCAPPSRASSGCRSSAAGYARPTTTSGSRSSTTSATTGPSFSSPGPCSRVIARLHRLDAVTRGGTTENLPGKCSRCDSVDLPPPFI